MFIVDNASNMQRAILDGDIPYIGFFAQTPAINN